MTSRRGIIKLLILFFIDNKYKLINSTYALKTPFIRLGIINSVEELVEELNQEKLLNHEGVDEATGLIKNIRITETGIKYLNNNLNMEIINVMELEFDNFDFIKNLLEKKIRKNNS